MQQTTRLVLGSAATAVGRFAEALGGTLEALPGSDDDAALEAWRTRVGAAEPSDEIVIAVWRESYRAGALVELDDDEWRARAEEPLLAWNVALGAASARCADGGAIVAVVEAPATLDSAGWVPELGLADAVSALVRSIAQSEGPRGVRANTVIAPVRLGKASGAALLPGFPGTLEREALGAAEWLLGDTAGGVTGRTLAVDFGRSW